MRHGHARFLPAIEQIKNHCEILNVDAGIDYRLRTLTQAHLFLSPLTEYNRQQMDKIFTQLASSSEVVFAPTLTINHRPMVMRKVANGVLAVNFDTLCVQARSQLDYIELSALPGDDGLSRIQQKSVFAQKLVHKADERFRREIP